MAKKRALTRPKHAQTNHRVYVKMSGQDPVKRTVKVLHKAWGK